MTRDSEARRAETRRRLIEAARALLVEGTAAEVPLREVAARCDLTVAAVYTYFQSKEDLLAGVAEDVLRELNAEIDAEAAGCSGDDLLPAVARACVRFARGRSSEFRLLNKETLRGWGRGSEAADLYLTRLHEAVAAAGFGQGAPEVHGRLVLAAAAIIHGLASVTTWPAGPESAEDTGVVDDAIRALVAGFRAGP